MQDSGQFFSSKMASFSKEFYETFFDLIGIILFNHIMKLLPKDSCKWLSGVAVFDTKTRLMLY